MDYKKENTDLIKNSSVFLENRKKVSITGVFEVLSFDEDKILLNTVLKKFEIIGNNLKISKLDLENGEVSILGNIHECKYLEDIKQNNVKPNFLKNFLGKKK